MGKGAGIEDNAVRGLARLVDPVDELPLVIVLPEIHREIEGGAGFQAGFLDIRQRLVAIDLRLAQAEQIEVRPVEDQNRWVAGQLAPPPLAIEEAYNMRGARA